MDVVQVETKETHATDVVDLDSSQETSGPCYAVNLPSDLDPVEPSLQCKFIKWDALLSFLKRHHSSQQEAVKSLNSNPEGQSK